MVWCSCCRKKKGKAGAPGRAGNKDGDLENGVMQVNEPVYQQQMVAADVYKTEHRNKPPAYPLQAVPLSIVEPSDLMHRKGSSAVLSNVGPLGAGPSALAAGAMSGGSYRSDQGAQQRNHPTRTASRSTSRTSQEMQMPAGVLPVAPIKEEYNDALLTWIGGQLSREREAGRAPRKVLSGRANRTPSMNTAGSVRSRYDDVSAYEIEFEALRMGKLVGEGSFGKCYKATWNETAVAVKVLVDAASALDRKANDPESLARMAAPVLDKLADEAGLMASMRHPNIIQFMGIVSMPPCVVTEYCERGSLADVLKRARKAEPGAAEALGWRLRLGMAADAATGMLYLHARPQPIIHRDLKSPNLLVDRNWRVKVCDFNMSRIMEESGQGSSLAGTNPRWLAPELLTGESATTSSDVFAFGVVMWELLTWELPWMKENPWSVAHMVGNGGRLTIPARWDLPGHDTKDFQRLEEYLSLMQRCWAQNPYDRPGFSEIIQVLRALEAELPQEVAISPAGSSGKVSRTPSERSTAPSAPPAARPAGSHGGGSSFSGSMILPTNNPRESYPDAEYEGYDDDGADDDDDYRNATASVSSTAVVASIDHTASLQWRTKTGWGTQPPK